MASEHRGLGLQLADALAAVEDVAAALLFVRPSGARDAAVAGLKVARAFLHEAVSVTDAVPIRGEDDVRRRDLLTLLLVTTTPVGAGYERLCAVFDAARGGDVAAMRDLTAAYAEGHTVVHPEVQARLVLTFWGSDGPGPDQVRGLGGVMVGEPGAVDVLRWAVDRSTEPLGQATLLLDLGTAELHSGDVMAACEAFAQAAGLIEDHGLRARGQRLMNLRRELHPWNGLDAVRELDDRLADIRS